MITPIESTTASSDFDDNAFAGQLLTNAGILLTYLFYETILYSIRGSAPVSVDSCCFHCRRFDSLRRLTDYISRRISNAEEDIFGDNRAKPTKNTTTTTTTTIVDAGLNNIHTNEDTRNCIIVASLVRLTCNELNSS